MKHSNRKTYSVVIDLPAKDPTLLWIEENTSSFIGRSIFGRPINWKLLENNKMVISAGVYAVYEFASEQDAALFALRWA